jgi:signal transduction histidine kinase
LTNVARHSEASRASLVVERRDGHLHLIVEDDGKGFEPAEASTLARGEPGLGLLGIKERAALLNGTVEIESSPDAGTSLFVRLPIVAEAPSVPPAGASERLRSRHAMVPHPRPRSGSCWPTTIRSCVEG